jgi:hypothetical protein
MMATRTMSMYSKYASRRAGLKASGDRHDRHEQQVPEVRGLVRAVHVGIGPDDRRHHGGDKFPQHPAGIERIGHGQSPRIVD